VGAEVKAGVTDVFSGGSKWLMGARWEEIDEQFVWKHRLSKSVIREGIMDLETGKTELFEPLEFPSCSVSSRASRRSTAPTSQRAPL
jgi:hypothetical protein